MKMILTSTDFLTKNSRNRILKELKDVSKCKILFIPNENATIKDIYSNKYYDRLENYGFTKENIFIFDKNKSNEFKNLNIDAIYIGGGNTFSMLKILKDTNFDKEIIKYIKNGVIYIGGSAGVHLTTKSIEHVSYFDENKVNLKDLSGLGLFDGIIICHYTKEREFVYNMYNNKYNKVLKLKDDEYIIIE